MKLPIVAVLAASLLVPAAASAVEYPSPKDPGKLPPPHPGGEATLHVCKKPRCFRTIQQAVNASRSGDTIRVANGTYKEGVQVKHRGRRGLKIIGNPKKPGRVVLNGKGRMTYRGRINDLFISHGKRKDRPGRHDLRIALDETSWVEHIRSWIDDDTLLMQTLLDEAPWVAECQLFDACVRAVERQVRLIDETHRRGGVGHRAAHVDRRAAFAVSARLRSARPGLSSCGVFSTSISAS